jgi:hypothetical protein
VTSARARFVTAVWIWNHHLAVAVKNKIGDYAADPQRWFQRVSALTMEHTFIVSPPGTNAAIAAGRVALAARQLADIAAGPERAAFAGGWNRKKTVAALEAVLGNREKSVADVAAALDGAFDFPDEK